ncbi:MAG TPA: hypothetical protein VMI94_18530 [Bryobacteraceae bacterium]|nr:hypothetical protein [Bryobacteraceae bacterium]
MGPGLRDGQPSRAARVSQLAHGVKGGGASRENVMSAVKTTGHDSSPFRNAHHQTLSEHIECLLDTRQFGGVPGIEHSPNLSLIATELSRQLQ